MTRAWCRKCGEPVAVLGEEFLGRAVHEDTGSETGGDGHLAAPAEAWLVPAEPQAAAG